MNTVFVPDPPRVFISYTRRCTKHGDTTHSCTDPKSCQTSAVLAGQLAQALEARGFVALWDKERLEVGDPWRDDLVDMMDTCDAAIVLLSQPALESDWVLQEATILKYRHDSGGLHLLPVALPGFRASQLADSRFAPLHLDALQMLATTAFTDPSPGLDALMDVLGERFADWNDDRVELRLKKHIRAKLGGIDENLLDLMKDDLAIARSWIQHDRLRRLVVREVADALLEVGVDRAAHVLGTLVSHIDERNLKDVLRWVEPFWVDRRAARAVRRDPVGKAFAVNACLGSTAVSYLARATCDQFPWTYAEVLSITGEQHDSELKQMVLTAFAEVLLVQPAEVPEALALELADGPVFVVLSDHVADRVLAQLRRDDELRGLSFLVLTGEARRPDLPGWPGDLELIEPPLEHGAELRAAQNCQDARDHFKVIINKLRRAQAAAG